MTFLTSWLVLFFVPFSFTPYGFVTGLFMVPGGTAGYFAVRNAGMAVSQGIWASLKVLTAFAWGIFVFHEPLRSVQGTAMALTLMLVGLIGMSYFATASKNPCECATRMDAESQQPLISKANEESGSKSSLPFGLSRLQLGILAAIFDGAYGGTLLVPMHYADPAKTKGLNFVLSFSIGCTTVVTMTWILRYLLYSMQTKSFSKGWERLPSFHFKSLGPSASLAGLIWSAGNVGSILSVAMLGQGLGYSIIQSQMLVAGLFGVFYYREIRGPRTIASWFFSAILTVVGIILLSQEHVPRSPRHLGKV